MISGDKFQKVTNKNDNFRSSWLMMGDPELNRKCVPYITQADWFISKFCKSWWKNQPQYWDYQRAQFGICATLLFPPCSKEWTLRYISIYLECHPLEIMNDPSINMDAVPYCDENGKNVDVSSYLKNLEKLG